MKDLFKGYLPANGKKPLLSVKDKSNWLIEPPTEGDYVGILNENVVQVDFDNANDAQIALNVVRELKLRCDVLETTRGYHFYFLNDGSIQSNSVGVYVALGLLADIGCGSKNRTVPLRLTLEEEDVRIVNGEVKNTINKVTITRQWIQTYNELDKLPAFFRPIGTHCPNFKETKERNQTLFEYILKLQSVGFTKDESRQTIKLINKHLLYEPLSDREIDTITRDEAFSQELFYDEKKFLHDKFGNYMLANCNILLIDKQLCIYKDGVYTSNQEEFERVMLSKIPNLKDVQRKEVYKYLYLKCDKVGELCSPSYIALKNEILNIETMETFPYSPKIIITNKINYDYNPNAYYPLLDKTLDKITCNNKTLRLLIEEMIGYTLYRKNSMQVAFILLGEGSNGKSTLLNLIKKLLGKTNYTCLDMRELEDTFKPAELYGKLANIGDDISQKYLDSSSLFKKIVTGESFLAQRKYAQPFELESYAKQIFCANELPLVEDKSNGFHRRLIIIPFNAVFNKSDKDYDPFIEEKLTCDESMEYLLKLAIEGLKRVLFNKAFTTSDIVEKEQNRYLLDNNSILQWFDDMNPKIENEPVNQVYRDYQIWCSMNGFKPFKKTNLSKEIKKFYGLVSVPHRIEGKVIRIYKSEGSEEDEK